MARAPDDHPIERALEAIDALDRDLHAFAFVDPDLARFAARTAPGGPLHGVPVGIKDVFDTADQPTEYGSPIYRGHRPRADAATVALLRAAGAVVVGKTVTAELAWFTPGPTVNPHRATHTPGGSSSGSAAAVAAGLVDLALGTQTAGSVIRPASFCGVFGYKPTFGVVPTAGVKPAAPSLDTVGWFARDVALVAAAFRVLARRADRVEGIDGRPGQLRFALVRTEQWADAEPDARRAVEDAARAVGAAERDLPAPLVGLAAVQPVVQAYEGARALAWERLAQPDGLSDGLRRILDWGDAIAPDEYDAVLRRARQARDDGSLDALFGDADVLVTLAVPGEAPSGLHATGDPRFCRLWTLLGLPALSVPGLGGDTGMPIGVQLVARPHADASLLAAGHVMAEAIGVSDGRVAATLPR